MNETQRCANPRITGDCTHKKLKKMNQISYDMVHELFKYHNGELYWAKKIKCSGNKIGDIVGSVNTQGYKVVCINGRYYRVHRLIYLFFHGYLPENFVDHLNRNRLDNRIENLREVSNLCNSINTGNPKNNKSSVCGVRKNNKSGLWLSQIRYLNKTRHIARSDNFDDAVLYRLTAEICLGWNNCNTHSPAYEYAVKNKLITNKVL